ncbi:hypothetical protein [Nostoc sp. ChiSLP03a]|uniref:hypothetical protein n=1 Tax=Nostoc sp. ChiSLP03a TaxID=3075380 RepID=UPI002AD35FFD|nr:hypothetical protein [Nostoc sp. ChiSLP03a]MDZ8214311.1 hypothetical protein [Nostoc sp. ChiSLP03a]
MVAELSFQLAIAETTDMTDTIEMIDMTDTIAETIDMTDTIETIDMTDMTDRRLGIASI